MKPLKTTYLLFALLLAINPAFSQKKEIKVVQTESVAGKNLITGSEIKAIELAFPERIYKVFLDTATNLLTVQLRGLDSWDGATLKNRGTMVQYDTEKDTILWKKKINYPRSTILQSGSTIIHTVFGLSNKIDIYTGKSIWEVERKILYFSPASKTAIGYFKGNNNELDGIDLSNGKLTWYRRVNNEYGWNDLFFSNDSTIVVVADGLHTINIHNGKGWDYYTVTGEKDYSGTIAANAVGAVLGILTGFFAFSTGYSVVNDIVSNALGDSTSLFLASKTEIFRIDKQSGKILWKYNLPKNMASKSSLFMNDTTVFMVNKGYAYMGNWGLYYGRPFIAAFDKQTGEQRYMTMIAEKNNSIQSFDFLENDFFCMFTDKLIKFHLETGNITFEKNFPKNIFGALKYFSGNRVFIKNDNDNFVSLWQNDSTKLYVFTDQDKLLMIDDQLNVENTIEKENIYIYDFGIKNYGFFSNAFSNKKQKIVVHKDGTKIMNIELSTNAFILNDILYNNRDKSFIAIDLKQIP